MKTDTKSADLGTTPSSEGGLPLWLSLAFRELRNAHGFAWLFALSLSLGLSGFLILDTFKRTVSAHLDERSRAMLGADIAISGERPLTPAEASLVTTVLPAGSKLRAETSFLSMVASERRTGTLLPHPSDAQNAKDAAALTKTSRLVNVQAVDSDFPYYGDLTLRVSGKDAGAAALSIAPSVLVYPELLAQLGLQIGDSLRLGDGLFTIINVIDKDPQVAGVGLQIAPKIIVAAKFLTESSLLGKGSRTGHSTLVRLPSVGDATDAGSAADTAADKVKTALASSGISGLRVRPHRAASAELYRALLHLADFLGLVALVALFLAGVGSAYLFRGFLERRSLDIAILRSLGLGLNAVRRIYITQLLLLGSGATLLTIGIATLLLPLVPRILGTLMPSDIVPQLALPSVLLTLLMGTGGGLTACLPMLARLGSISPQALFQEAEVPRLEFKAKHLVWWLPALTAFGVLAVVTSRSLQVGGLFSAIFLGATALCAGFALLLMRVLGPTASAQGMLAKASGKWPPLPLQLAALALARQRLTTLASVVALGLSALLFNIVPQIRHVLISEIGQPEAQTRPSLFLFDIQEEQVANLTAELKALKAQLTNLSPMVRGRLLNINGEAVAAKKNLSEEDDGRSLSRGFNLSYRAKLDATEELVSGRAFAPGGAEPQISLEQNFADRMHLKLGDHLRFDVEGVEVEGVVVNTRRVHWTSFQPNFFIEFAPGALDEAPKTFVAGLKLGTLSQQKAALQSALVDRFPNISIIDVEATIERILGVLTQMQQVLTSMTILALLCGLAVLYAIARLQARRRLADVTLLKVLGMDFGSLWRMAAIEFGILGIAASALGGGLSIVAAFILGYFLFDQLWVFDWQTPLLTTLVLAGLTLITGLTATGKALRGKAVTLLGQTVDV